MGLLNYRGWTFFDWKIFKSSLVDSHPQIPVYLFILGLFIRFLPLVATLFFLVFSIATIIHFASKGINLKSYSGNQEVQASFFILLITIVLVRRQFLVWLQKKNKDNPIKKINNSLNRKIINLSHLKPRRNTVLGVIMLVVMVCSLWFWWLLPPKHLDDHILQDIVKIEIMMYATGDQEIITNSDSIAKLIEGITFEYRGLEMFGATTPYGEISFITKDNKIHNLIVLGVDYSEIVFDGITHPLQQIHNAAVYETRMTPEFMKTINKLLLKYDKN